MVSLRQTQPQRLFLVSSSIFPSSVIIHTLSVPLRNTSINFSTASSPDSESCLFVCQIPISSIFLNVIK
jgi:hypothetical protein